jgi:hypothetical protein
VRSPFIAAYLAISMACARSPQPRNSDVEVRPSHLHLTFTATSDSFQAAAHEYDSLWAIDGDRVTHSLEAAAHLSFAEIGDTVIRVLVFEGASSSGYHERPMQLRASYPADTKKATLMHELGHRLQSHLFRAAENDHPFLFLWLYDAWIDVYGDDFAQQQVGVEKRRGGVYPAAWDSTLALSHAERVTRWDSVRTSRFENSRTVPPPAR